jgi:hypothetical protein
MLRNGRDPEASDCEPWNDLEDNEGRDERPVGFDMGKSESCSTESRDIRVSQPVSKESTLRTTLRTCQLYVLRESQME